MTQEYTVGQHNKIESLLAENSLHEVFSSMRKSVSATTSPIVVKLLDSQEETYKYMLHYLVEGFVDSHREELLKKIISNLYFINDSLRRDRVLVDSSDIYSSTFRFEKVRKATFDGRLQDFLTASALSSLAIETGGDPKLTKDAEDALISLFAYVWTMFGESDETYVALKKSILDPSMDFAFKAQMISALMLGNIAYYDPKAVNCLMDVFEADADYKISARALVALVLIFSMHPERVKSDVTLQNRLRLWEDSIVIYRQLREVVMSIIRAHDTQRISSKMQNEVLPELMKLRPEILNKLRNISEVSDMEMLDVNPEWEEIMNKSGIADKLKELTEMQMEGGDVMMMAFSNLKSFPFFNAVANWFMPFSPDHSEIAGLPFFKESGIASLFDMQGMMCDSDKFSFALSLQGMPEQQRNMISQRMGDQIGQFKEVMADKKLKSTLPEFDSEVTRYVRDIYRFFKLYKRKADFKDPFGKPFEIDTIPVIRDILADPEILNLVGEFYFKRGYYSEALPLLLKMDTHGVDDSLLWEKIGYCYNAVKDLEEALKWYKKAELLHPESQWLIKKIALCSRMLSRFKEASEYYEKALEKDPDNYHLLMSAGHSLLEGGDVASAITHYYHADYIKPDKAQTIRSLAWAEFLNSNYDKSLEFYQRILLRSDSSAIDHLNAGHVYFMKGNIKKALESYKRSVLHTDFGLAGLQKAISEDCKVIEKLGGNISELHLMVEKLKYDL